jgi:hypothetical protein
MCGIDRHETHSCCTRFSAEFTQNAHYLNTRNVTGLYEHGLLVYSPSYIRLHGCTIIHTCQCALILHKLYFHDMNSHILLHTRT